MPGEFRVRDRRRRRVCASRRYRRIARQAPRACNPQTVTRLPEGMAASVKFFWAEDEDGYTRVVESVVPIPRTRYIERRDDRGSWIEAPSYRSVAKLTMSVVGY